MNTITDFLLDRIAEDEAVARATLANFGLTRDLEGSMLAHVAHFDPARILTECEAKRRIVELHGHWQVRWEGFPRADREVQYCMHDQAVAPCPTLRALAQVYSDHPSFDPTWNN